MSPWLIPVVLFPPLVVGVVVAIRFERSRTERRLDAWRRFASERGFRLIAAAGPWYRRTPVAVDGTLEDVAFRLDTFVVSTGHAQITYTRVRGFLDRELPAKVVVSRRTAWTGIGETLGRKRVRTGDPVFDEKLVVRSKSDEVAKAILDAAVRERAARFPRGLRIECAGREAKVWWQNTETDPDVLEAGCRLLTALCRACARV